MSSNSGQTLVVLRHSPYGSGLSRSGIDAALAAGAFEQSVNVLFLGAGVLQLIPEQDASTIGSKNIGKNIASLPLYDIETFWVDAQATARFGIDPQVLPPQARLLDRDALRALMCNHQHLLSF
jgi:tRNA 2-thiouridine synthesizing protein C